MYLESSPPNVPGDRAQLASPPVIPTGPKCLRFWYLMHGGEVGNLKMYVVTENTLREPLWARYGTQGKFWHLAEVF